MLFPSPSLALPPMTARVTARNHETERQQTIACQMKTSATSWLMLIAITTVAGLAYLDEERESEAALSDFAEEQTTLARGLATNLRAHLATAQQDAVALAQSALAGKPTISSIAERYLAAVVRPAGIKAGPAPVTGDRAVRLSFPGQGEMSVDLTVSMASLSSDLEVAERPNRLMLLLRPPGADAFYTTDGRIVVQPEILLALDEGRKFVRLAPAQAGRLGLPTRTALAGLARINMASSGAWGMVAVASAERERDRELWARWRLILSTATASGLVLSFGGLAMHNQRKKLLLQHQMVLRDFSRERDERLDRAGRAATMGTLAVGVAHEISTPLGIIAGRAEQLLPRLATDERATSGLQIILEQIDHIHRIIRGLLGLARGDRPTAEPLEPAVMVQGAIALVEHRFDMAGVRLTSQVPSGLPVVHGDRGLLEHAVVNLLLNASDACGTEGNVEVSVFASEEVREICIAVVDDGPGISRADRGRLLEPFFSTKPSGKGTGIGLAIVQEIVTNHRGSLTLEHVSPHGTRAVIRLPVSQEPSDA